MTNKIKHFTASALIIHDNKVLLIYHKKLDVWLYPGGHVEESENPDETLIREVKEETGLDVEIVSNKDNSLANEKNDISSLHIPFAILCELVGDHYHNDLIYLCRIKEGEITVKHNAGESDNIGFFSYDEIADLKLFDNFRVLLCKVLT
ncbi:MAG: NUDIX domain-containing protein [Candidatus Magasanikbacteria bacterium]|nr:NUDIX domain-containing protein [Candidatus Magasanikbacteria bacterium]